MTIKICGQAVIYFARMCATSFALVDTDNYLLGALQEQGFSVIPDLNCVNAHKQGLPPLEILDLDRQFYAASSKLATLPYSKSHILGLREYAAANTGKNGHTLQIEENGRWMLVQWKLSIGSSREHYLAQLEKWKRHITALNNDVHSAMRARGEDSAYLPTAGKPYELKMSVGVILDMPWIPAGSLVMGSTALERKWAAGPEGGGQAAMFVNEGDPNRVEIPQGFWLGKTEITVGQWKVFVQETGYQTVAEKGKAWGLDDRKWDFAAGRSWKSPGYLLGGPPSDHPVVYISWNDAISFCEWLTTREQKLGRLPDGYEYRLPSEAEWDYACRGNSSSMFWWGDRLVDGQGRFNGAGSDLLTDGTLWDIRYNWPDGHAYLAPVDSFGAGGRNGFGLADMLGNAWEWCLDGYDAKGPHPKPWFVDTSKRVFRGGSFATRPARLRCAFREGENPLKADVNGGFRACLGPIISL